MTKPIPTIEEVIAALPFHQQKSNDKRLKILSPYWELISTKEISTAFEEGAIIEPKHPEQKWNSADDEKPFYKENEAYFWLVAHTLFWKCNIAESVPPDEQVKFMKKQHIVLRSKWVDVVVNVKLDVTRKLAMECLRADLYGASVCGSFHDYPEWWGDPSTILDPSECASWSESAKMNLIGLVMYSKSAEFKATIADSLYKDSSEMVRRTVTKMIEGGSLPSPSR